ncbi:MAG TPA: type II toxin-antitoxin system death-on-curing family toxin [Patescibacteria group bacterium]|nr:type II toxin-antitoxin system death-on-curing family toxin [Patescibacteria group bacterium]
MKIKYVGLEEILRLHFQIIEDFGGSHGVRDEGRLQSVVQAPKQIVFGEEQYPSIFDKAAVYLRNIIGDHPFSDGNKRTAVTVCGIFLARNGIVLRADPKDLENFTVKVATHHLKVDEIATWLKQNSN